MPVTRGTKEKSSRISARGQQGAEENVRSGPASKAPRSKPSRSTKQRERNTLNKGNDGAPVTTVTTDSVDSVESLTNADDVATLKGVSLKFLVEES
jgi:hypothetical protein